MCENKQDPQKSQVINPVSKFNLKIDVDLANSQNKAKLSSMTYEGSDKIMAFSGEKVTYEVMKYFNFRTCLCKTNIDDRCYVLKIGDYKKDTPIKERLLAQLLSQGKCILPDPTPLMLAEDALISVNKTDQTTTVFGNPAKMVKLAGVSSKDETVKVYKLPETEDMNSLSKCCGCFGDRSSVKPALESKAQDVSTPHREIMIDMSDFPDSVTKKRKIEETEQNTDLKSDPTTNTGRCSGTLYSTTPGTLTVTTDEFDSSFVPIFFDSFVDPKKNLSIYATEYVGQDMYDYIRMYNGYIPESDVKSIARQLLLMFRDLHALGIAHCDVSVENLCIYEVDNVMRVKLLDFGLGAVHPSSKLYQAYRYDIDKNQIVINGDSLKLNSSQGDTNTGVVKPPLGKNLYCTIRTRHTFIGRINTMSYERLEAHYDTKKKFCAYKDDIHALGVVIFSALTKLALFDSSISEKKHLDNVYNGGWRKLITMFVKRSISAKAISFLNLIFRSEDKRSTIDELLKHEWLM
ncbi:protein kinase domain containing protein [Yasminevirus sp. GU-2018]|uniref:Protein kinase domain containing protein n=1 Tax=Yasminevirus sp. GU-2018 TaxID=2420051 RepID=A0A5K0U6Z4_9VIRU|nr:protein kinase domain containing protein [Yasminevirus sp. GU-2018]